MPFVDAVCNRGWLTVPTAQLNVPRHVNSELFFGFAGVPFVGPEASYSCRCTDQRDDRRHCVPYFPSQPIVGPVSRTVVDVHMLTASLAGLLDTKNTPIIAMNSATSCLERHRGILAARREYQNSLSRRAPAMLHSHHLFCSGPDA